MEIAKYVGLTVGLTVATGLLSEAIKKLPDILEARSLKNEIESDLGIIERDLEEFETKVDSSKKIEVDEFIRKCTDIYEKFIPVKIKVKRYSASFDTARGQAEIDIAFNLLKDLDSELQVAKTDKEKIQIVQGRTVQAIMRKTDPKIARLTLRMVRNLSTKIKKKPSPEVIDEFKHVSHRFAMA